ncbi:protein FAR-RED ELONGATED HYPOCOTYL 3-like [Chenopodium quinoa]|uniref:protein FAR-RED ELONGATED HYPOCOTYL 3-like n=1 Tax=Chenopodium quinoa TaxID=63459 RepID=UPI000B786A4B|nr:protein FAR-RED ELONGATED HYPOCOTYL 3-like [Chenopodium quinoa]
MPFEQKDLHDEVAKQNEQVFDQGDAKAMFAYFNRMVEDNDKFFYKYRVDEECRLKDAIWIDARSRAAYEEFGDIVVFDSAYLTNEYKLPFCNFVGVNHDGQTILLGCALVSHETAETFEWEELHQAVYDSLDCEEFEQRWPEVIKKYKAEDDQWLEGLFEERAMWVPAFLKHLFWAGMKTTQRVESIHSFFDGYLSKHTLLHEFVERYEEALSVRSTSEKKADDNNARYVRKAYTNFPAELLFQKIYTDAKFKEVQRECSRMMYVSAIEKRQVSEHVEHVIEDRVWFKPKNSSKEKPSKRKRRYVVTFDIVSKDACCECKYFECHGIICRHIIKVYELMIMQIFQTSSSWGVGGKMS